MAARDIFMWFMGPQTKAAAIAESKKWIATCPNCGQQTSVWDLGGMRFKAAGEPLRGYKCQSCGKFGMHKVQWLPDSAAAKTP